MEKNGILGAGGVWFAFASLWRVRGLALNSAGLLLRAEVSGLVLGCLQHPAEDGAPLGAFSSGNQSLLKGVLGGGLP